MSLINKVKNKLCPKRVCSVVVVAAGSARRMQGIDKILSPISGVPILARTLSVFQSNENLSEIVVVTREDLLEKVREICKAYKLDKVSAVIAGGAERLDSVRAGLRAVRKDADLIAIHDGARPFLSQTVLNEVVHQAKRTGAAAPAIPLNDTIKRVDMHNCICQTVDRGSLRAVQTPQVFHADLIRAAIEKACLDGISVTDDCSAVEQLGMTVVLTPGDAENIKVTTPFDIVLANAIIAAREEREK